MEINRVKAIFSCHRSNASFPYYSIFKNSISSIDLDLRLIDLLIMMPMVNALFLFFNINKFIYYLYSFFLIWVEKQRWDCSRAAPAAVRCTYSNKMEERMDDRPSASFVYINTCTISQRIDGSDVKETLPSKRLATETSEHLDTGIGKRNRKL